MTPPLAQHIDDVKRIIGKQEEELHQAELRVAALEAENAELKEACDGQWKTTVRQRERAEQAEAELATVKAMRDRFSAILDTALTMMEQEKDLDGLFIMKRAANRVDRSRAEAEKEEK